MGQLNDAMNEQARRAYKAQVDGDKDAVKGFHMYKNPYLWEEENPVSIADTPTENFIPTPIIDAEEETNQRKVKRGVKIALLVLVAAFMVYALVSLIIESPQLFEFFPG